MAERIDTDALKASINLVELVQTSVALVKRGKSWLGLCPFHEDTHPSLDVDPRRGTYKCFACGEHGDAIGWVMKRDGVSFIDAVKRLSPQAQAVPASRAGMNGKAKPPIQHVMVAEYDYVDENGEALYQVVRMEPKTFRQRRLVDSEWCWGILAGWYERGKGDRHKEWFFNREFGDPESPPSSTAKWLPATREVPYRLPQVIAAAAAGETIYIPEGEKDVENIERAGAVGTCNSGGAGKWKDEYSPWLKGARAVVIRDKDKAGFEHADAVSLSLRLARVRTAVVETRVGKDASDHLDAGFTLEQLIPVRSGIPYKLASEVVPKDVQWLIGARVPLGMVSLLVGDPGEGKSGIALSFAAMISRGKGPKEEWFTPSKPRSTIYLNLEDSDAYAIAPRLQRLEADTSKIILLDRDADGADTFILDEKGLKQLEALIIDTDAILLVLDPLVSFLDEKVDMRQQNEVRSRLKGLGQIAERNHCAVLALIHLNKARDMKAIHRVIGSIDFVAFARSVLYAGHDPDDHDKKGLVHIKCNVGGKAPSIGYAITDEGLLYWTGASDLTEDRLGEVPKAEEKRKKAEACDRWLENWLTCGVSAAKACEERAREAGFSKTTLYESRTRIRVSVMSEPPRGRVGRAPVWWARSDYDWDRHQWPDAEPALPVSVPEPEYDPYADEN